MKVVFVDDDPDIRDIVELALKLYSDIDVRTEADVQQAITCAIEWQPDLVVTDLNMPGLDGTALLAYLKENPRTQQIPIVFLTANSNRATRDELLASGALAILEKPFDPRSLGNELVALISGGRRTFDEKIVGIRNRFRARAAEEADALQRDWSDYSDDTLRLRRIAERAHALAGTASMLEFKDIFVAARRLEQSVAGNCGHEVAQTSVSELCEALKLVAIQA